MSVYSNLVHIEVHVNMAYGKLCDSAHCSIFGTF